jgi:hypothetical protein
MSEESRLADAPRPVRRIVTLPVPQRATLPVALIAHKGEERDQLEAQIARSHPVIVFPSFAHFGDASQPTRWAGIVVARTHAWDARLDSCVQRRAFIALCRLSDEGYGWPDAVRRLATPEELDAWLLELSAPVLPAEDRPHAMKPKAKPRQKRGSLLDPLATPRAEAARVQLAPSRGSVTVRERPEKGQLELPSIPAATAPTRDAGTSAQTQRSRSRKVTGPTRRAAGSVRPDAVSGAAREGMRPRSIARAAPRPAQVAKSESQASQASLASHMAAAAILRMSSVERAAAAQASAREERRLSALALEIGLVRAAELLSLVRMRARALQSGVA